MVDRDNIPKGVIGARDLKRRTGQVPGDICREIPDSVTSDATLRDAFSMMLEYGQSYVVVTDKNNSCQGYITLGDLLEVMKGNDVS